MREGEELAYVVGFLSFAQALAARRRREEAVKHLSFLFCWGSTPSSIVVCTSMMLCV